MAQPKLLPSQRNNERIAKQIRIAFAAIFHRQCDTIFEHGHWWAIDRRSGAQYDAVDATGGRSVNGFDFEQVPRFGEE